MEIDADAPPKNLDAVQFRNWDKPGVVMTGEKAAQHAKNLRLVAGSVGDEKYAGYLRRFADQLALVSQPAEELEPT